MDLLKGGGAVMGFYKGRRGLVWFLAYGEQRIFQISIDIAEYIRFYQT